MIVSPAETAEPIEMAFGLWTRVGSRNCVLNWSLDPSMGKVNFERKGAAHCKAQGFTAVRCAKMTELIELLFGMWIGCVQGSMY